MGWMKQKTPTAWKVTPKSIDVHLSESPLAGQIPICKIWIWWIFYKMKFGRFMNFTAVVVFSLVFQSIYNIISTLNILISCFSRFIEHPVKRFEGICIQDGQLYDQRGFKGFLQLYFSKLCNFIALVFLNDLTIDLNSQYFWKWTNANPMKIFRRVVTASKL